MPEFDRRTVEPVAIVGIGCRFPGGANDTQSFWSLLIEGRSGIRDVPDNRWNSDRYYHSDPMAAGAMVMRRGGFVDNLDAFDAAFWGVSPREAVRMDPQQRWLLEVAWEAIEDARIAPSRLRGCRIGVFVGISGNDYGGLQLHNLDDIDAYTNSGATASIASNRVSYLLDLRGPSVSLDTACSSSLVAVAAACENLWSGHCEGALAGGVSALISPETGVGFSKASMISPTGQCFAFDARANGFVRAEGAALVYLKPLSAALAARDRVYAVVRAVVVNQDGHTSSMTVPSVDGQAAMLEDAYRMAGISPARVAYVEAHGTGTPVGDPIEAAALGRVLGRNTSRRSKCMIGSVKTNIGHLESGSGIAGLIKAALVLHHRTIPAMLNFERPNPDIPFDDLGLEVATEPRRLPAGKSHPPVVGVNSFGFGGTNAHAVLEAAPPPIAQDAGAVPAAAIGRPHLLPISARDPTALRAYVRSYRDLLADGSDALADLCASAGEHKEHHHHRLVLIGRSRQELRRSAATWLRDGAAEGVVAGRARPESSLVFVFAGQGPQWWAMGRQLLEREPVFRETMHLVDTLFRRLADWSILTELLRRETDSRIDHTDVAQPAIFALQVSLVELWKTCGIRPAKAIGHSVGEVAAAYCAGVYSLEDAVRIISNRARLQHRAFGRGRMLVVALSPDEARAAIDGTPGVELAAINSPRLMTLAGEVESLRRIEQRLQRSGVFARWLRGQYAFHSVHMDPIRDEMLAALRGIRPQPEQIPLMSTVTGERIAGEALDESYWWKNIRQPVLFGPAIARLIEAGDRTFLEISPHPVLESSIQESLAAQASTGVAVHSLRREVDESNELATNLASLHVAGIAIDWNAINQSSGRPVCHPPYPWNRESFWAESGSSARLRLAPCAHPLLGQRIESAVPIWQMTLDLCRLPYLKDHRVWDSIVFPGAAYCEMGLALGRILFPGEPHAVEDLEFKKALFLIENAPVIVQTVFTPADKSFAIYSAAKSDGPWELHAQGSLMRTIADAPLRVSLESLRDRLINHMDHRAYSQELDARGFQFGAAFRQVRTIWWGGGEALVEISPCPESALPARDYVFHPALLDACFHAFVGLLQHTSVAARGLYLPRSLRRVQVYRDAVSSPLVAHAARVANDGASFQADIRVYDSDGTPVADLLGFRMEAAEPARQPTDLDDCYYQFRWTPRRLRGSGVDGGCAFAATCDITNAVAAALPDVEHRYGLVEYHREFVPEAESVASLLAQRALQALRWQPQTGDRVDFDSLVESLGIVSDYHRVTKRLLRHLEKTGVLQSVGENTWEVMRPPDGSASESAIESLAVKYPAYLAEIDLFRGTGLNLAAVLAGETDPLELLFPGGSHAGMERFYGEALGFPAHLELTRIAIAQAIATVPPRRTLRVLEVGAGTGVLTRTVLPLFAPNRTEYVFTDVGAAFISAARQRFADVPFVDYQLFDIEIDPERQGVPSGHFDLILGADVVHATADLRVTLANLQRCLAPGGLLLLLELAKPYFVRDDVTFGLLRGYARFRDFDLRETALATPAQWRQAFSETGLLDIATIDCSSDPQATEHAIILGCAPSSSLPASKSRDDLQGACYLLVGDHSGVTEALAKTLGERGHAASIVRRDDRDSDEELRLTLRDMVATRDVAGVIHLGSLDRSDTSNMTLEQLGSAQSSGLMSAFELTRALANRPTRMWYVTRHAQSVSENDRVEGLASAPLIGFVRVANNEHQCRFSLVDLDTCSPETAAVHLADEVTLPSDGEFEVAYRNDVRHVLRLQRTRADELPRRTFNAVVSGGRVLPFRLETQGPGILSNLALYETQRAPLGPTEVEVRVHAAGINFRDVMKVLGTYPGSADDLLWFGDDLSGTVERVGKLVTSLEPGDDVAGMAPYAFRAFAATDARMLFRKPAHLSFVQAASLPTIFLTAHHAIHHLARMQPGESILIHAGTGGVGQAAIQIAKRLSLTIFATAGTPEKRRLLRDMGVSHVMSSRTLEFADEVMQITGGRGVDAVLNSLAGDFIPKSLSVLAPFGRFLEIGKVDIYRNSKIGLLPLRNNISYFVIDLTQHLRDKRDFVVETFRHLAERFAAGEYEPVPLSSYAITDAAEAFRSMAQAKHVGKNVLTFDHEVIPIAFTSDSRQRFRADATYVITGGAGGFGLEVAKWIASHGGRHVVLMSRSGPRDATARQAIEDLRADGVAVVDARGDVASAADVERIVSQIQRELPPLKGVFHAAMVLDDDLLVELDQERIWAALAPKMAGAWNLHRATLELPIEHFVCFSSFSSVIGLLRQSNYNAGNAFLDALAHYRRARHLPALTINWGAIRGAGFIDRDPKTSDALRKVGLGFFDKEEALRVLEALLIREAPSVVAARVDWKAVSTLSSIAAASNTYTAVRRDTCAATQGGSLAAQLHTASADEQERLLQAFIVAQVAQVLGTAEDKVDRTERLTALGLDSLMTLELTNRVERQLAIRLPVGTLLSGPTIIELATSLRHVLAASPGRGDHAAPESADLGSPGTTDAKMQEAAGLPAARHAAWENRPEDHIVAIKRGSDVPVFCFHALGGGVGIYAGLSQHVPDTLPLYGVESRLLRGAATEYATLDEMADAYVTAVYETHPGPYRLLGFSFGGYLAARVAEGLERRGAVVEGVGVMDWDARRQATPEAHRAALVCLSVASYQFLQREVGILRERSDEQLYPELATLVDHVVTDESAGGEVFFRWVVENELTTNKSAEDLARQYLLRFEQHCRLLASDCPRPEFSAPLIVWRARDGFGSDLDSWERGDAPGRDHVVEGDHNALLRAAGLRQIAHQMMDVLQSNARLGAPLGAVPLT